MNEMGKLIWPVRDEDAGEASTDLAAQFERNIIVVIKGEWDGICPNAYAGCFGAMTFDTFREICSEDYCSCLYFNGTPLREDDEDDGRIIK